MNNFKIEFFNHTTKSWEDYSKYAIFPLKTACFLDEQLDEVSVSLKRVPREHFIPLTLVRITEICFPESTHQFSWHYEKMNQAETEVETDWGAGLGRIRQSLTTMYLVANDKGVEAPIGVVNKNGKQTFDHDLYLIELTKIMEGFIGDSTTVTNVLGNTYVDKDHIGYVPIPVPTGDGDITTLKPFILSPTQQGTYVFPIKQFTEEYISWVVKVGVFTEAISWSKVQPFRITLSIFDRNKKNTLAKGELYVEKVAYDNVFSGPETLEYTFTKSDTYEIEYRLWFKSGNMSEYSIQLDYAIAIVGNRLPLKKWTIADVVCRECELIEPLYLGEKPRFRLKGAVYGDDGNVRYYTGHAEKLNKILSPEFSFAKMNLRERLQQIGGRIHAEPRITNINFDDNGKAWFEVDFDFYGSNKKSNIKKRHRITATTSTNINDYATALDTSVDNLISQLDWADGVVVEPFGFNAGSGSGISLRTEQTGTRLAEDDSTYIPTSRPIYQAGEDFRLKCVYIPGVGYGDWDITPFLFEQSDYNLLSSYDGAFPFSKAFALYYSQGSKNIKGLFFKQPSAIHDYLKEYAITNILESVTGQKINIEKEKGLYGQLQFVIEYVSINTARIRTNKSVIVGGFPRQIAYNQGANFIESRFYGENLKGVIARLGNPEKVYTYAVAYLSDIPKIGTKFDDEYYISSVSRELLPSYIKVTVSLSKNFNRKSQYVGINSNKRMWEVSEKQSVERQSNITEYVLINTNSEEELTSKLLKAPDEIADYLMGTKRTNYTVDACAMQFYDRKGEKCVDYRLALPVASLAMGNSLIFSFNLEDNYSAGKKLTNAGEDNGLGGLWVDYVPYADYYGRAWAVDFTLYSNAKAEYFADDLPMEPINKFSGFDRIKTSVPLKYRKDNREIPSFSVEFVCVTNDESIVIGSALTKNSLLVRNTNKTLNLYGLRKELNVLDSVVDLNNADLILEDVSENALGVDSSKKLIYGNELRLPNVSTEYVAWALCTAPTSTTINVEDENGEETTQTIYEGGELVIGQNGVGLNGQTLYFTPKRSVYD